MTLTERAQSIRSSEDFVAFLEALSADFATGRGRWTNADLPSFLEAMAAWSQDMDGFYASTGEDLTKVSPWRVMADMLMAARTYE